MNDLIAVEKIAQWQKLKGLVLDSVSLRLPGCAGPVMLELRGDHDQGMHRRAAKEVA
jgi:hypothetical protein